MKVEKILICVFALILGMLVIHMFSNVCGCKSIVEGQCSGTYTVSGSPHDLDSRSHSPQSRSMPCDIQSLNTSQEACLQYDGCTWTPPADTDTATETTETTDVQSTVDLSQEFNENVIIPATADPPTTIVSDVGEVDLREITVDNGINKIINEKFKFGSLRESAQRAIVSHLLEKLGYNDTGRSWDQDIMRLPETQENFTKIKTILNVPGLANPVRDPPGRTVGTNYPIARRSYNLIFRGDSPDTVQAQGLGYDDLHLNFKNILQYFYVFRFGEDPDTPYLFIFRDRIEPAIPYSAGGSCVEDCMITTYDINNCTADAVDMSSANYYQRPTSRDQPHVNDILTDLAGGTLSPETLRTPAISTPPPTAAVQVNPHSEFRRQQQDDPPSPPPPVGDRPFHHTNSLDCCDGPNPMCQNRATARNEYSCTRMVGCSWTC